MNIRTLSSAIGIAALSTALTAAAALAAPNNAGGNPNIVANYDSGLHGIPGEFYEHSGTSVVMMAGKSGRVQAWFYGTSTEGTHGDHDVWRITDDGTCKKNETLVPDAYPAWGDYLVPGADYCVKNNDFHGKGE